MNKTQVALYTSYLHVIGGIETFLYNLVDILSPYYDMALICPQMPAEMASELAQKIPVYRNKENVACDTLIMIRIMDEIPKYVSYKRSIRMCHACRSNPAWYIKDDCDSVVHVSETSRSSFGSDGEVILNPVIKRSKKALFLVSATRIPATDKGRNADRMIRLADMLNGEGIPFVWLNFSDAPLENAPHGLFNVGKTHDIQSFISKADYLVQLSDQEGFGYSVAEALINGTAVICTPFKTTAELGVIDGENGYIIPFDMGFDVKRLLDVPTFTYDYDNDVIAKKWRKLLGNTKPTRSYKPPELVQTIVMIEEYQDLVLHRLLHKGERVSIPLDRAMLLEDKHFIRILSS